MRHTGPDPQVPSLGLSQTLSMIPSPSAPNATEALAYPTSDSLLNSPQPASVDGSPPTSSSLRSRFSLNSRPNRAEGQGSAPSGSTPGDSQSSRALTVRRLPRPSLPSSQKSDITLELERLMGDGDTSTLSPTGERPTSTPPRAPGSVTLSDALLDSALSAGDYVTDPVIASILRRKAGVLDPEDAALDCLGERDRKLLSSLLDAPYPGGSPPVQAQSQEMQSAPADSVSYEDLRRAVLSGPSTGERGAADVATPAKLTPPTTRPTHTPHTPHTPPAAQLIPPEGPTRGEPSNPSNLSPNPGNLSTPGPLPVRPPSDMGPEPLQGASAGSLSA